MSPFRPSTRLALSLCLAAALTAGATIAAAQDSASAAPDSTTAHDAHAAMRDMHHASGWKEMDAFHMVMMETWHPAKATNDLHPIRTQAAVMAERAAAWQESAVPAACDSPATRETVAQIAADSRALANLVAKDAPDADVKSALAGLHDRFETVEQGCTPAAHGH